MTATELSRDQVAEVAQMRADKISWKKIGEKLGVTEPTAKTAFTRAIHALGLMEHAAVAEAIPADLPAAILAALAEPETDPEPEVGNRTSDTASVHVVITTTQSNEPEVHDAGCADIKRGLGSGKYERAIDLMVDKVEDAAGWFWEDFLPGGCAYEEGGEGTGMTLDDAQGFTKYLPCTRKLAGAPQPEPKPEPVKYTHCVKCGWKFATLNRSDRCGAPAACAKRQADPTYQSDRRVKIDA